VLRSLQAACKGLLWPSESDKPVKAFLWPQSAAEKSAVDADSLRAGANLPADAVIERTDRAALFTPLTTDQAWFGPIEKANAQRFRQLQEALGALSEAKAFRVISGDDSSKVALYLLGGTNSGSIAGVQTELVET
jgi:hypothetical protein